MQCVYARVVICAWIVSFLLLPFAHAQQDLLQNGGFEEGGQSWTQQKYCGVTSLNVTRSANTSFVAHSGSWLAVFGDVVTSFGCDDYLNQMITIPGSLEGTTVSLSFWLCKYSATTLGQSFSFKVVVGKDTYFQADQSDLTNGTYVQHTIPLNTSTLQANSSLTIQFHATFQTTTRKAAVWLDDVALTVTADMGSSSPGNILLPVIIGVCGGVALLLLVVGIVLLVQRRRHRRQVDAQPTPAHAEAVSAGAPPGGFISPARAQRKSRDSKKQTKRQTQKQHQQQRPTNDYGLTPPDRSTNDYALSPVSAGQAQPYARTPAFEQEPPTERSGVYELSPVGASAADDRGGKYGEFAPVAAADDRGGKYGEFAPVRSSAYQKSSADE